MRQSKNRSIVPRDSARRARHVTLTLSVGRSVVPNRLFSIPTVRFLTETRGTLELTSWVLPTPTNRQHQSTKTVFEKHDTVKDARDDAV